MTFAVVEDQFKDQSFNQEINVDTEVEKSLFSARAGQYKDIMSLLRYKTVYHLRYWILVYCDMN